MEKREWERILNQLSSASDVYRYIGNEIIRNVPNTVVILVQNVRNFQKGFVVDLIGLDAPIFYRLIRILGLNPIGKVFNHTIEGEAYFFTTPQIQKFTGSLYEFSGGQFPKWMCQTIEFAFGIKDIYTMGLSHGTHPMGSILIFPRGESQIKSFKKLKIFNQLASERLYQLLLEDDIKQNLPSLKKEIAKSLLNNISHEIRSPLNQIVGLIHLSNRKELTDESREEMMQGVWSSARDLTQTIDRLIELSELESGLAKFNFSVTPLTEVADILRNCINDKSILFGSREYNFTNSCCSTDKRNIKIDTERFERICSELIENAFKFSRNEVIVSIYADEKLYIQIKDAGVGISFEDQNRIFDSFVKLSPSRHQTYQGIGLGLSIAFHTLKRTNSKLTVESEPGKGSVFSIEMPIND